jgi:hypothetical protein
MIVMVVGYVIGSIFIAFGIAVLHKIFTGSSTGLENVYYPFVGVVLVVMGGWACYGYASGKSKNLELDTDSPPYSNHLFKSTNQ